MNDKIKKIKAEHGDKILGTCTVSQVFYCASIHSLSDRRLGVRWHARHQVSGYRNFAARC